MDEYGRLLKNFVLHEHIEDYDQRPEDDFKVIDRLTNRIINIKNKYKLTKRELEIVELLHQGQSTKQISEKLFLSEFTVKTHRKNILQKTNSNSTSKQLIRPVYKKTSPNQKGFYTYCAS